MMQIFDKGTLPCWLGLVITLVYSLCGEQVNLLEDLFSSAITSLFNKNCKKRVAILYFFLKNAGICSVPAQACRTSHLHCRLHSCPRSQCFQAHDHNLQSGKHRKHEKLWDITNDTHSHLTFRAWKTFYLFSFEDKIAGKIFCNNTKVKRKDMISWRTRAGSVGASVPFKCYHEAIQTTLWSPQYSFIELLRRHP